MEGLPLVSIIIPAYNAEKFITEAIDSSVNQTWPNKEIIVIDDGSSDNTLHVAQQYAADCVKVYSQSNRGASVARNKGLSLAKGKYIQFLDADDILDSQKISMQVKLLEQNPGRIAVCSTVHFAIGTNHLEARPSAYEDSFLVDADPVPFLMKLWGAKDDKGSMIQPNAWLAPRIVIDKAGLWNEELTLDDDGEFFCRVILASGGIIVARDTYNYYRKNTWNTESGKRDLKALESAYASICLKHEHLRPYQDEITERVISRSLTSLLMLAYPQHKDLSKRILNDIERLGGFTRVPVLGGKLIELIKKLFGWKIARLVQHYSRAGKA